MHTEKAAPSEAIRLVRMLNEEDNGRWRIQQIWDGHWEIWRMSVDPTTKDKFWFTMASAEDRRDLARLARDFGLQL